MAFGPNFHGTYKKQLCETLCLYFSILLNKVVSLSPLHSKFFECAGSHTHGARFDPPLVSRHWAADHGGTRWTNWPTALPNAKSAGAETCAGCAHRVSKKAFHQAQGRSLKTMSSLPFGRSARASFTSTDDPCTDRSRGQVQTNSVTSRTLPQCSIASDLGGTAALAADNPTVERGICSDVGAHTDMNVGSCIHEAGTNGSTGSARRRRYGDPSHRVPFCFSAVHDKLVANVDSCIGEADPWALVPFSFIGSDNGKHSK